MTERFTSFEFGTSPEDTPSSPTPLDLSTPDPSSLIGVTYPVPQAPNPFLRMMDFTGGRTMANPPQGYAPVEHAPVDNLEVETRMKLLEPNDDPKRDWGAVKNLDVFFQRLFNYYQEKGFSAIVTKRVINALTLGFTVVLSTLLIGFVKWDLLVLCQDEDTCEDSFDAYLGQESSNVAKTWFVWLYFTVFSMYWLWTVVSIVPTIRNNWEIRQFYQDKLGLHTRELQTMEWSGVVDRLIHLQDTGKYMFQINNSKLTARNIAMRIMRKENYLIALVNHNVLPLGSRLCGDGWFLGKNLEVNLQFCIFNQMFNDKFALRRDFVNNPAKLSSRFVLLGLLNLVATPFSLGFVVIYFFLRHAEEFHSKRNYLGPRWWSPHALWEFREFNELPNIFERRMYAALKHAEEYVQQFPSPVPSVLASGVSFVAGGVLGILLLFTFIDESILLHVKFGGRNLLWYVAIFSAVLTMARAMVIQEQDMIFNPNTIMRKVVAYTHYLPDRWRTRCHTFDVRDAFCGLFQYKFALFLHELLCILTTPFVLIFVMPRYTHDIVQFVQQHTAHEDGVGDVCVFSQMDLQKHGDSKYGAPKEGPNQPGQPRVFGGKLEKSWLNFRANYPNWCDKQVLGTGGAELLDKLSSLQESSVHEAVDRSLKASHPYLAHGSAAAGVPGGSDLAATLAASVSGSLMMNSSFASNTSAASHASARGTVGRSVPSSKQGFFDSEQSAALPLGSVKFPNSENYFYWLEEFRDRSGGGGGPTNNIV